MVPAIVMASSLALMGAAEPPANVAAPSDRAGTGKPDAHMVGVPPGQVAASMPKPRRADPTEMSTVMRQTSHTIMMPGQDMPPAVAARAK